MEELVVEWDDNKNTINRQVHHISFETAKLVFADPDRIERLDNSLSNSSGEIRWQTLGLVGKVLFVVYTERGENIRLISARLANKKERSSYYGIDDNKSSSWAKAN
ncbi:MAG: BrnT family toxin [Fibromonadales bacterium]|nr:BrnT family toxin [Fibromonadales bacterium]